MINENRVLSEANSLFIQKKFEEALFLYSLLISNFPQNKEYKLYALLCDIAFEDIQKALTLFDYYAIVKEENKDGAVEYIEDMIKAYDGDLEKMMRLLKEFSQSSVEDLDAINYNDFKKLIKQRGSFKVAFEDIMFSTKVAIENKEDFYDFISKLIDNGFNNMAYTYLEGFNEYFTYDKEISKLYKKLEENQNETRDKQ